MTTMLRLLVLSAAATVAAAASSPCSGVTLTSLTITFAAAPSADAYHVAFGAAGTDVALPSGAYTTGNASATVGGLKPATSYWFKVRAHKGTDVGTDHEWGAWGAVFANCSTAAAGPAPAPQQLSAVATTRVYRVSEAFGQDPSNRWIPSDFLRNHNSADAAGQATFLTYAELALMAADQQLNSTTITEYCVETAAPMGEYLSCPPGGSRHRGRQLQPGAAECFCAHDIDRFIQHKDLCSWHGESCGSTDPRRGSCGEMWSNLEAIRTLQGKPCIACDGKTTCKAAAVKAAPLCDGCSAQECEQRWAAAWCQALGVAPPLTCGTGGGDFYCSCNASVVAAAKQTVGVANVSYPPGLGRWFSTAYEGDCGNRAPTAGAGGCGWRRQPRARVVYGFQLVERGFRRPTGADVIGQNVVPLAVLRSNVAAFVAVFADHPLASSCLLKTDDSTFEQRCEQALQLHVSKPWPSVRPSKSCRLRKAADCSDWGLVNLAFAKLALGSSNATVAAEISAEVETYETRFRPWANYSVKGPMGGLGPLPILARMALLEKTRNALTPKALSALEKIMVQWLSPRSKVVWAGAADSWLVRDGSENLDATRKASLYLAALVVNRTTPDKIVALDGKPVHEHVVAWEKHWRQYFLHFAAEVCHGCCLPSGAVYCCVPAVR